MTAIAAWRIRPRLILAFVGVLVPYLVLAGLCVIAFRIVWQQVRTTQKEVVVEMKGAADLQVALVQLVMPANDYLITGDPAERGEFVRRLARAREVLTRLEQGHFAHPEERRLLAEVRTRLSGMEAASREILAVADPRADPSLGGKMKALDKTGDEAAVVLSRFREANERKIEEDVERAAALVWRVSVLGLGLLVLSVGGGVGLALLFAVWLSRPIRALEAGSREMAQGNLSHRIAPTAGGELGEVTRAFNEMAAELQAIQQALADRVRALEEALAEVKQLREILPICSYCKKIRDDQQYWQQLDAYIGRELDVRFSHGVCPECREKIVKPQLEQMRRESKERS